MRHGKKNNHLGRKSAHRKSMMANMLCSLIEHKRINTTLAKAKVLRKEIEPILTRSKSDTTHNRRIAFSYLRSKDAVTELFREVSKKVADRPGGYTRIIKMGNRLGDNADMAMIELVDYNELYTSEKIKKTTTRRGRKKTSSNAPEISDSSSKTPATEKDEIKKTSPPKPKKKTEDLKEKVKIKKSTENKTQKKKTDTSSSEEVNKEKKTTPDDKS